MDVKTRWGLDVVEVDDGDPLADDAPRVAASAPLHPPPSAADVEVEGAVIDLRDPDPAKRVMALFHEEESLRQRGIVCEIKDDCNTCCSACPIRVEAVGHKLFRLCQIGVQQEEITTRMVIDANRKS